MSVPTVLSDHSAFILEVKQPCIKIRCI